MKPAVWMLIGVLWAGAVPAQETGDQSAREPSSAPSAEAEEKFRASLTNATLEGRWCPVGGDGLGSDRDEKYEIQSVERVSGDNWLITAKMRYRQVELTLPFPVQVKWAGDTPVLVVDNVGIPGGNKYSARVMIYNGTYSGTWTGGEHGGLLHGVVKRREAEAR